MRRLKEIINEFVNEEDGIGVVEIILILVILVGLVVIFKDNISDIVEDAFKNITDDADEILD